MTKTGVWCLVLALSACAAGPESLADRAKSEYRRESSRIEAREDFEQRKQACARAGGALQVVRASSGRLPPTADELRLATCSASGGAGLPF